MFIRNIILILSLIWILLSNTIQINTIILDNNILRLQLVINWWKNDTKIGNYGAYIVSILDPRYYYNSF